MLNIKHKNILKYDIFKYQIHSFFFYKNIGFSIKA